MLQAAVRGLCRAADARLSAASALQLLSSYTTCLVQDEQPCSSSGGGASALLLSPAHAAGAFAVPAVRRGFAAFSSALAHSGCGHSHHHGHGCSDDSTLQQIQQAGDLQQLQQLVAASGAAFSPAHTAAALRHAAALAGSSPADASGVVGLLAPLWLGALPAAAGGDVGTCLLSLAKLRLLDEALWQGTLAAVPSHVKVAGGQDLANIAYSLAAMAAANGGSVPGVPRDAVKELLRNVTHELVGLVRGAGAGDGCGSGRQVSVGNIATMRWANEVFEELDGGGAPSAAA